MQESACANSQSIGYENDRTLHCIGNVARPVGDSKSQPGLLITTISQEEQGGYGHLKGAVDVQLHLVWREWRNVIGVWGIQTFVQNLQGMSVGI